MIYYLISGLYTIPTLIWFTVIYFFTACWTYGVNVPSGLFVPCILTGAAWGRILGELINLIPGQASISFIL